jgi:adenylate cyclase
MSFWKEAKRRKVVRVIIAYLLVGWGLIQIADATLEPLRLPEWGYTLVVWLVGLGFPIAVVLGWVLDITPEGIKVTADTSSEPDLPQDASIAVLPFVNMSGSDENEYFSDGLSEELLNLFVRLKSVRVCSRTSSFSLKGKDIDMPTIAAQLGVRHVLEGSVRRSGDKVRITAQLVDAAADCHLWSETYDRQLEDIFAVQDEIASQIFQSLQITLTPDEQHAAHSTTDSVDALDYYLRGRDQYHRTEPGHLQKSCEMFEEAIRVDPEYALAWAGLTYIYVDTYWYKDKDEQWIERAFEASEKAVELAPHLAESHAARGLALRANEQFDEAKLEFEKSISINPRLFEPVHFYAQMARSYGDFHVAAELFEKASQIRPEDYQALALAANMHEALGNKEQQDHFSAMTVSRVERATELNPKDGRAWILGANCLRRLGDNSKALEWLEKANAAQPNSNGVAYNSACVYANMGDTDRAIELIEKAIRLGSRNRLYFETDPDFEKFKDDPRFIALLDTI